MKTLHRIIKNSLDKKKDCLKAISLVTPEVAGLFLYTR